MHAHYATEDPEPRKIGPRPLPTTFHKRIPIRHDDRLCGDVTTLVPRTGIHPEPAIVALVELGLRHPQVRRLWVDGLMMRR